VDSRYNETAEKTLLLQAVQHFSEFSMLGIIVIALLITTGLVLLAGQSLQILKGRRKNFLIPMGCILCGLSLILLVVDVKTQIIQTESWRTASGEITKAEIVEEKYKKRILDWRESTRYLPEIEYVYTVNNVAYKSTQVKIGDDSEYGYEKASELVANYKVGDRVTIFYNPQSHGESVLIREDLSTSMKRRFWIGVALIPIGFFLIYYFYFYKKAKLILPKHVSGVTKPINYPSLRSRSKKSGKGSRKNWK
jgi:hypothetical protein